MRTSRRPDDPYNPPLFTRGQAFFFLLCVLAVGALIIWATRSRDQVLREPGAIPDGSSFGDESAQAGKPRHFVGPSRQPAVHVEYQAGSRFMTRDATEILPPTPARAVSPSFRVLEYEAGSGRYRVRRYNGEECLAPYVDRGIMLSEDQNQYPVPSSGCGPTAILNYLVWYENTELVRRSTQESNPNTYKHLTFSLIDQRIAELKGHARTGTDGANENEMIVAFDEIIRRLSRGRIRLAYQIHAAPVRPVELIADMQAYRAALLIVQIYDPKSPPLGGCHAVAVTWVDSTGRTTIANWGKYRTGGFMSRADGQWFVDNDGDPPMKVAMLISLIPFRPWTE